MQKGRERERRKRRKGERRNGGKAEWEKGVMKETQKWRN